MSHLSKILIGAVLCSCALLVIPAHAVQTECDRLAAHPWDPNRIGKGVPWNELNASLAISACKTALSSDPDNPRYRFQYGRALHKAGEYAEAIEQYRRAAKQGYGAAQGSLGMLYAFGKGVKRNDATAVEWLRKAAILDFAPSQDKLAWGYLYGTGIQRDPTEAMRWFRKAAAQGYAPAQCKIGEMYHFGKGVQKDDAQAMEWFRKAAAQGYERAQAALRQLSQ
jgi:TPR repeat protein